MKKLRFAGIIILVVVIGSSFTACDDGNKDSHTHTWGAWQSNATEHWKECSCGEKTDIGNHTGNPCTVCGYAFIVVLESEKTYYANGELESYYEYEYDSQGNKIKQSLYSANDILFSYIEYEYDSQGNLTKESCHEMGVFYAYNEYEYDTQGNRTKLSQYTYGELSSYSEFEYDTQGNLTKRNYYNKNGEFYAYNEYEYDTQGNLTKESVYRDGVLSEPRYQYKYEYDSQGNQTKEGHYRANGELFRYFENEYDSQGNRTKQNFYDNTNGELTQYTIYTYKVITLK